MFAIRLRPRWIVGGFNDDSAWQLEAFDTLCIPRLCNLLANLALRLRNVLREVG